LGTGLFRAKDGCKKRFYWLALVVLCAAVGWAQTQVDINRQTKGTLQLSRGGTGQVGWVGGRCVQVAADGSKLEVASTACVSGLGSSGSLAKWGGPSTLEGSSLSESPSEIFSDKPIRSYLWDRGGAVFNAKAFGAVGDGSTDDSSALRAAFMAAAAVKGVVVIPPGTYRVSETISSTAPITVLGAGSDRTIIQQIAQTGDTIYIAADQAQVQGLAFWPAVTRTDGAELHIKNVSIRGQVSDIVVRGPTYRPWIGLYLENTNTITVSDVVSYDGFRGVLLKCNTDSPHSCGASLSRVFAGGYGSGSIAVQIQATTGKAFAGTTISDSGLGPGADYGLYLDPNGGIVNEVFVSNTAIGSYNVRGIYGYASSGTGAGIKLNGIYIGSASASTVAAIEFGSMFKWIGISGVHHAGRGQGIIIRGADNVRINNAAISCDGVAGQIGVTIQDESGNGSNNVLVSDSIIGYDVNGGTSGQVCETGISVADVAGQDVTLDNIKVYGSSTSITLNQRITARNMSLTYNNLSTGANGSYVYCSNCTVAATCAAGGTGALAKRLNGTWVCN